MAASIGRREILVNTIFYRVVAGRIKAKIYLCRSAEGRNVSPAADGTPAYRPRRDHVMQQPLAVWQKGNVYAHGAGRRYSRERQNPHYLPALIFFGEYSPLLIL
jgi:hypothetical protein